MTFLARCSILEVLSGPACDAVLGARGSARRLSALGRGELVLVPVDRKDAAYRFHRLVREMLRAELRRRAPEDEQELHARAAAFLERAGDPDRALHHAAEAGDVEHAARLARALAPGVRDGAA